jgi:hypothetical protein
MVIANMVLSDGTKVTIEGSSHEVATLMKAISGTAGRAVSARKLTKMRGEAKKTSKPRGPVGYIQSLREEGFFKKKRDITEVQNALEEMGHIYAQASLSPALLHLVKNKRVLRRFKEGGVWKYVNR